MVFRSRGQRRAHLSRVMMVHDDGDGSGDTEQALLAQCALGSDFSV